MRALLTTSVASLLIAGGALAGVASAANAATARNISSSANAQYQARYDYAPAAAQPKVAQPQAVQPQADTAAKDTADDMYFYHAMGTMSHP